MIDLQLISLPTDLEASLSGILGNNAPIYVKIIKSLLATYTANLSTVNRHCQSPTTDYTDDQTLNLQLAEITITEQQAFNSGIDAVLSDEATGGALVKQASQDAVNAILKIETMFLDLTRKLTEIDEVPYPDPPEGKFTPRLIAIHKVCWVFRLFITIS